MITQFELDKIFYDLLGAAIVIAVLVAVAVIIKLIFSAAAKARSNAPVQCESAAEAAADQQASGNAIAGAGLKLIDVDEKTAALAMAIISHESGIPLSELIFRSIKLV